MSQNEHTGDHQKSRPSTDAFREGWDRIFGGASVVVCTEVCETSSEGSIPLATPKYDARAHSDAYPGY